jgi:hypothetical protein
MSLLRSAAALIASAGVRKSSHGLASDTIYKAEERLARESRASDSGDELKCRSRGGP